MVRRRDIVTRTVEILDILPGDPPRILTGQRLRRNGKPGRLFQQLVPVPDEALFTRLVDQVSKGDTLTITVTTEWWDQGYGSYLSDFASSSPGTQAVPEEQAEWLEEPAPHA